MMIAAKDLLKPMTDEQRGELGELVEKTGLHPHPFVRTRGLASYWITRLKADSK